MSRHYTERNDAGSAILLGLRYGSADGAGLLPAIYLSAGAAGASQGASGVNEVVVILQVATFVLVVWIAIKQMYGRL